MAKKLQKDLLEHDLPALQRRWIASGETDFKLLCLAIGKQPHQPPPWAMFACIRLYRKERADATSGHDKPRIGRLLDSIILNYMDHNEREYERLKHLNWEERYEQHDLLSFRKAATLALESEGTYTTDHVDYENQLRLLSNAWNKEAELADKEAPADKGVPYTPRYQRVFFEYGDKEYGEPLSLYSIIMYLAEVIERKGVEALEPDMIEIISNYHRHRKPREIK